MAYPKLLVIGFTNIDVNITPSKQTVLPGGAAFFVAVAASRYIPDVGLVTRVGNDFDSEFLLSRVIKTGVKFISDKPTTTSIQTYYSDTDLTQRDIELKDGAASDLNPQDIPSGWIENAEIIHIATMPPSQQSSFLKEVIKRKKPQTLISIDTDQFFFNQKELIPIIETNFKKADLIFANRVEYTLLQTLIEKHPFAVIKQDKGGAFVLKAGQKLSAAIAPKVSAIDVTGAGDIFAGTFLAQQVLHKNLSDNLDIAVKQASASVTAEGIQHLFLKNSKH